VKVNSSVIKVKCLISYIEFGVSESVIRRLKSNIVTAVFTTLTSQKCVKNTSCGNSVLLP